MRVQTDLVYIGAVNDASNRWHGLLTFNNQEAYFSHAGYIALTDFDSHVVERKALHQFHGIALGFPTP